MAKRWAAAGVLGLAAVAGWGEYRAARLRSELETLREEIGEGFVTRQIVIGDDADAPDRLELVADGEAVAIRGFRGGALKALVSAFPDGGGLLVADMTHGSISVTTGPLGPGVTAVGADGVTRAAEMVPHDPFRPRQDTPAMGGFGSGLR